MLRNMRLIIQTPLAAALILSGGCGSTQKKPTDATEVSRSDSRCDRGGGKRVEEIDGNEDGKPDVWKVYATAMDAGTQVSVLVCREEDLNHDGRKDVWTHYLNSGNKEMEEFDLDFDGKIDMRVFYQNGRKVREELDINFDGRPDVFKFFEAERLARLERSSRSNGKIDTWEYYEGGRLDRIGRDTTGAGQPDQWNRAPDDSVPAETAPLAPPTPSNAPQPRLDSTTPPADAAATQAAPADKGAQKAPQKPAKK